MSAAIVAYLDPPCALTGLRANVADVISAYPTLSACRFWNGVALSCTSQAVLTLVLVFVVPAVPAVYETEIA